VFVNPGKIGDESETYPKMGADEVADLVASPQVVVGNHTYSHADLTELSRGVKREEIVRGKEELEERFDITVDRFAYPWGRYDEDVVEIVRETHSYAVTTESLHVHSDEDSILLPRLVPGSSHGALRWDLSDAGKRLLPLLSGL